MGTLPGGVASTRAELLGGAASTGALSLVVRPAQGRSPADAGVTRTRGQRCKRPRHPSLPARTRLSPSFLERACLPPAT